MFIKYNTYSENTHNFSLNFSQSGYTYLNIKRINT